MHSPSSISKLEQIINGATRIGKEWSQKRSQLVLDEKSAGQFATNADVEIERFLRNELEDKFPGQSIIGEELGGELSLDHTGWALDPIDGTSNFALGLPIWAISVGYIGKGEAIFGAISLPDLDLVLTAAKGEGLRINYENASAVHRHPSVKVIALGENDFETGPQTDAKAEQLRQKGFAVVRYRCAVFSLAMSALGRLSGYVENGCGLWDIAAAEVICKEAGLQVQTANITEGRYSIDAQWAS
ncbi:MAG: inositol monophosphatase [Pseudomonadota bacterium]